MISVASETPLQDEVRGMIVQLNAFLRPQSPPEFQFQMSAEEMAFEDTTVFVAREDNARAVGMGSLKAHSKALGEVKRMFTLPEHQCKGVGSMILSKIVDEAKSRQMNELVLETGVTDAMRSAAELYKRHGFQACGPVLDYPDSGHNQFFRKKLSQ